ncbi:C1 family peptidase [Anaerostipes sp.]|uniref:C1 family peptidase n=1 Tax=Anaerostipes sp. TaxID=1872530 RepID=UPI0025B90DAE|nr:C1 family peptidase [Anaerostipes sp.]MBS7008353.1 hypothetical protein [Anaerostipes sp.]
MKRLKRGISFIAVFCICFTMTFQPSVIKAETEPALSAETGKRNEHFGEKDSEYGYRQPPSKAEVSITGTSLGRKRSAVLPSKYDGREQGHMTSVKDQGNVGACWTFAGSGLFESKVKTSSGNDTDLSEQHMLWTMNGLTGTGYINNTTNDNGGNEWMSAGYYASGFGPKSERDIPFKNFVFNFADENPPGNLNTAPKLYQATDIQFLNPNDKAGIKQAVINNGAVGTGIYWRNGAKYLTGSSYYCTEEDAVQNHEVEIVGWDDNYSKSTFKEMPAGNGAWLIKNSWGTMSGDRGYYWVSYEDTSILPDYTIRNYKTYDQNEKLYQWDEFGTVDSAQFTGLEDGYFINVFEFGKSEVLESVTFFTENANAEYQLFIAPVNDRGTPVLAEKKSISNKEDVPFAGYITKKISPLSVSGKNAVIVELKSKTAGQEVSIGAEHTQYFENDDGEIECYYKGVIKPKQSFAASRSEGNIIDIYDLPELNNGLGDESKKDRLCNFSIKATTKKEVQKNDTNVPAVTPKPTSPAATSASQPKPTTTAKPNVTYTKPYLSKYSLDIYKGNKSSVTVKNKVKGAKVAFSSSKKSVAAVNSSGKVTAKKAGTAVITAKVTQQGRSYNLKCKVKVSNKRLAFSKKKAKIKKKKSYTFKVKKYGVSGKVKWKVSNKKLASIGKTSGKFKAKKKKGKVKITAYCGKYKVSYTVRIY